MCILCVVQKWSRRVATMLPWLVIPLIGLWALSQLLPPGFRFEVTSPRLACVLVLLVTLFWYEVLMPQLSAWRLRRSARLRERKRFEAIEMQKLRKTATRRCRNCLTPYRDQNPGGGRFMCSYCGHISKRPVLDMPGAAGLGISNSGIIGDLVGKGGKIWNGKVWSENGWICTQEWLENGNWVSGSFSGKTSYLGKNRSAFSSGDDCCLAEKSYSGVLVFGSKLLSSSFLSIRWLWRKISRVSSAGEDTSSEVEHKGVLSKKGENGINFHESRGEKARRKAEEKKQARLEREILEEEERKQREEVARLVEERRRLRDEKIESEKEHGKGSDPDKGRDSKREAQRKRQEKRKEKDKGSSKSNSDVEELEKRAGREGERKGEFDKRIEIERRELQRNTLESVKAQGLETGHSTRSPLTNNFNRGNVGTRYLDRMKGTFLSSKAFSGGNFFGKGIQTSATAVSKANKSNGSIDNVQTSAYRREVHSADHVAGKLNSNGDDKITDTSFHHNVGLEQQRWTPPKKSWQQLFTRSSAVSPSPMVNVISRPSQKLQGEVQSPLLSSQGSPPHPLDNPIHFGLSLPFTLSPFPTGSISSGLVTSSAAEPTYPIRGSPQELISEEPELFEDPCYVPDPVSLLGPVSESLDNFLVDLGSGFVTDVGLERPHLLKNLSTSTEANKPSPIESPMSRLRVSEERHATCNLFNSKNQDLHASPMSDSCSSQQGTWQMWGTSPLGQDGLGLVGGSSNWFIPGGQSRSNQEDILHPSACKAMIPQFVKENKDILSTCPPQKVGSANCQNGGMFSPLGPTSKDNDMWLEKNAFDPLLGDVENHFLPLNPQDIPRNEMSYGSPSRAATIHPFELSPANCWSKTDWGEHGTGEGVSVGTSSAARPHIGGLFSTPDVQSVWSFN